MTTVHMVLGYPASGKSGWSKKEFPNATYLNRDTMGGKVIDLIPHMIAAISDGKEDIVLDNLFPTVEDRKPFIEHATLRRVNVVCHWMQTSVEDAQINALTRMWDRYGKVFLGKEDLKEDAAVKKDPNMFPVAVLFRYRKIFQKPTLEEGFSEVNKIPFVRQIKEGYTNKAVLFDYDDTLRETSCDYGYPTNPDEVTLKDGVKEKLQQLKEEGYLLLGVSNQSGVAKGRLSHDEAVACFEKTNELAGADIEYSFCPHSVPPSCYCRKPQSGMGVHFIEKYRLNPHECIVVGDQTSDKTFAKRLGMSFEYAKDFFA